MKTPFDRERLLLRLKVYEVKFGQFEDLRCVAGEQIPDRGLARRQNGVASTQNKMNFFVGTMVLLVALRKFRRVFHNQNDQRDISGTAF